MGHNIPEILKAGSPSTIASRKSIKDANTLPPSLFWITIAHPLCLLKTLNPRIDCSVTYLSIQCGSLKLPQFCSPFCQSAFSLLSLVQRRMIINVQHSTPVRIPTSHPLPQSKSAISLLLVTAAPQILGLCKCSSIQN